jgi:hypothetical protein
MAGPLRECLDLLERTRIPFQQARECVTIAGREVLQCIAWTFLHPSGCDAWLPFAPLALARMPPCR